MKDELQRDYYFTLASANRWSVRQLRKEIDGMLYERTALSSKPEEVVKQELANVRDNKVVSPDVVFKSPYFLEFTGLKGLYSEKDLEDSLVAHLEQFILELGNGFCFAERQKRMIIDGEDFYLDLLFYHRKLHRLIAIDLKLGRFKASIQRSDGACIYVGLNRMKWSRGKKLHLVFYSVQKVVRNRLNFSNSTNRE